MCSDRLLDIQSRSRKFVEDRQWQNYQTPKNLSMALIVEAAELVEHFQWVTEDQSQNPNPAKKIEISNELADILIYLLRIADELNIDIGNHALKKIELNHLKYPISSSTD